MKWTLLRNAFLPAFILIATTFMNDVQAGDVIDGVPAETPDIQLSGNFVHGSDGRTIDIVGDTSWSGSGTGRAKGNSYRIDMDVVLTEFEFWLIFTDTQLLTYHVFVCPDEFGTYNEVYRNSIVVSGYGADWYSSGSVSIAMDTGFHYIIIVSWDGDMTYFYDIGDSQATSFGSHTHAYASGYDPLSSSFSSLSNDQAIYHQRLTTVENTGLERSTWGSIKSVF